MVAQTARDAKELRPPVFTREQAVRGRALYGSHCARCHGADLRGREHAPSLLTLRQWSVGFVSLGRFFGYVYANMPPDTPGQRLSLQTHVDIVAYILERNRYPAGDIELPADVEAIDEMSFSRQGQ
jgi:polar amino acid transport system substrate-binding protein